MQPHIPVVCTLSSTNHGEDEEYNFNCWFILNTLRLRDTVEGVVLSVDFTIRR